MLGRLRALSKWGAAVDSVSSQDGLRLREPRLVPPTTRFFLSTRVAQA